MKHADKIDSIKSVMMDRVREITLFEKLIRAAKNTIITTASELKLLNKESKKDNKYIVRKRIENKIEHYKDKQEQAVTDIAEHSERMKELKRLNEIDSQKLKSVVDAIPKDSLEDYQLYG